MGRKKWKSAYYDTRTCDEGDTRVGKFRVILPNGKFGAPIETPTEALKLIGQMWHGRRKGHFDKWYGFRIGFFPDGNVNVKLNYDAKCFEASDFQ